MNVSVSALGNIRKYIPEPKGIVLKAPIRLSELKEIAGIPAKISVAYAVNDKIQNEAYRVQSNDRVKFIMIVGAG